MPFTFTPLELSDVVLIESKVFPDDRGYFVESFKRSEFEAAGLPTVFVQENYSHSVGGVLRGLHYQKDPAAQGKLVWVARGSVFDVAADVRRGSPTFGRWSAVTLTAGQGRSVFVPEGFAHGFCALTDEVDLIYLVTREYAPEMERGIIWDDADLAIAWPIDRPILSPKDAALPPLRQAEGELPSFLAHAP